MIPSAPFCVPFGVLAASTAFAALTASTPGNPDCFRSGWSAPVTVWSHDSVSTGTFLFIGQPVLVPAPGGAFAIGGTRSPLGRPGDSALIARRIGGGPLGVPAGGSAFVDPAAALDASGTLHMVWADRPKPGAPFDGKSRPHGPEGPLLGRVLYARYRDGRWSHAEQLYAGPLRWYALTRSDLLVDGAGRLHLVFQPERGPLVHLRSGPQGWKATELWEKTMPQRRPDGSSEWPRNRPIGGSSYAHLALGAEGRMYLVFMSAAWDTSGSFSARSPSNAHGVFLMRSKDNGSTWDAPVLANFSPHGEGQTSQPRLVVAGRDTLHLLWGKNPRGGLFAEVVRHATSTNRGESWTAPTEIRVPGEPAMLHNILAVRDVAGAIHLAFRAGRNSPGTPYTPLGIWHARWEDGAWAGPQLLRAESTQGFDLSVDGRGRLHLLWEHSTRRNGRGTGRKTLAYATHPACPSPGRNRRK